MAPILQFAAGLAPAMPANFAPGHPLARLALDVEY
jgi:hypothetical protein